MNKLRIFISLLALVVAVSSCTKESVVLMDQDETVLRVEKSAEHGSATVDADAAEAAAPSLPSSADNEDGPDGSTSTGGISDDDDDESDDDTGVKRSSQNR
jgi:hypothetical protein